MNQSKFNDILNNEIRPFVNDLIHKKQLAADKSEYVVQACKKLEDKLRTYDLPTDAFKSLNVRYRNLIQEEYK